ncbi:MAG TPA: hypothetical protein VF708_15965 [Pyrinomonadaceae bacterium]
MGVIVSAETVLGKEPMASAETPRLFHVVEYQPRVWASSRAA